MRGNQVYLARCASCHGLHAEGNLGPNLQDNYWIHGNRFEDIVRVTYYGVPEKGKVGWKDSLSIEAIHDVATFLMIVEGSPASANAKDPEGRIYPPARSYYQENTGLGLTKWQGRIEATFNREQHPVLFFGSRLCGGCCPRLSGWLAMHQYDDWMTTLGVDYVEVDNEPAMVAKYQVSDVPTLIRVDRAGEVVERLGFDCPNITEEVIEQAFRELLPD